MADIELKQNEQLASNTKIKYKDMGDGTYALILYVGDGSIDLALGAEVAISAPIDSATGAIETVDYSHHEVHSGGHYFIEGWIEHDITDTLEWVVTTPDTTKWAHMDFRISGTDITTIDIYEGSSNVVNGTPITALNSNRNSANTSVLTILRDPSSITDGVLIGGFKFGSSGGGNKASVGGSATRDDEMILKQNTTYLWRITSGADDNYISFRGNWYEHTNVA